MQLIENRWQFILLSTILVGALSGMLLSWLLIDHHYSAKPSALVNQLCGTSTESGCNVVNRSAGSTFLGLPVAWWGWLYYSTVLFLVVSYFIWRENLLLQLVFNLAIVALGVDFILFLYSLLALGTVCNLCLLSYGATVLTLFPAYFTIYNFRKKKETYMSYLPQFKAIVGLKLRQAVIFTLSGILLAAFVGLTHCGEPKASEQTTAQDYNALLEAAYQDFKKAYLENPVVELGKPVAGIRGKATAMLKIHEFADPLCPYCALMGQRLKSFAEKYPDDVQIIYRHFPLDNSCNKNMRHQLHKGACELSYAMQCAKLQGKFFEVHDAIFANQKNWAEKANLAALKEMVQEKGLNGAAFQSCFNAPATKAAVTSDIELASKLNVHSTPTLFVNGRRLPNVHIDFLEFFLSKLLELEKQRR